jgi:hypothetical protein
MNRLVSALVVALLAVACASTSEQGTGSSATDAASSTGGNPTGSTGSDASESGVDCSGCTDPECLGSVSGRVLYWDGTPFTGDVMVCGASCVSVPCNEDGGFFHVMTGGCFGFDPEGDQTPDLSLGFVEGHTKYAAALMPPYYEIDAEHHIDTGTHYHFPLSGPKATYTEEDGAEVHLAGVSFRVPAGALGTSDLELHVFDVPLDEWTPPFVLESMNIDAVYYLSPHFASVTEGQEFALTIDPTAAGWSDGDSGALYRQGDYMMAAFLECDGHDVHVGDFVPCGTAETTGGAITTSPIDRLTWIGLSRGGS